MPKKLSDEELDALLAACIADELDSEIAQEWAEFDSAMSRRALTRDELAGKLRHAKWALDRECPEQADKMLDSALRDLE